MQAAPLLQAVVSLYIEKRNFVNNFGLNTFLEAEWARLRVPAVLRTFWLSRAALLLILQVAFPGDFSFECKRTQMCEYKCESTAYLLVHDAK